MSHHINYLVYPENVDKGEVKADLDEYVSMEDYEEGCSGLFKPIRWLDVVCDSEEEAEQYIKDHDDGWYDNLAVKFKNDNGIVQWLLKYEYHT